MLKRVTVLQHKPMILRTKALTRWLGTHRDLVRGVPGVVRYEQRQALPGQFPGSPDDILGIGEVTFDDRASAELALASPQWRSVIDDASSFAVFPPIAVVWVEE
jgi:uncharacterized protein (TIGR02118 family)